MTNLTVEQILNANKSAVVEAQNLAATALAGFQKLVDLNVAATKSALLDSSADYLAALSSQNPADALAAQAALVKPLAEKSIAYGRSVAAIASETTSEFTKVAEAKAAESQKTFTAALENLAKNAPAGSETVVAALKSAVTAGQQAIETAKSSAQKAMEMAEKQVASATDNALSAVKTTPSRKK